MLLVFVYHLHFASIQENYMAKLDQLFDMSKRVAVVTGATKGMGLAIARALGAAGAKLVISSRSEESAKATAEQLTREEKIAAHGIGCDITDLQSVSRFAKQAQAAFGRVDALILNAAGPPALGSILGHGANELEQSVRGLLSGNLLLLNEFLPQMIARKDGSIVLLSSILAQRGSNRLGLYGMAKAATDQLVRNLVAEIGASNVNANSINPTVVRTDFSRGLWENPDVEKQMASRIPLGRIAEAGDVAGLALLLASTAGRYITGQSILVDGGQTAV
jgi:NAD(P)-dependent dehydrogenase (short-subunit alcohol dehydrogenase family)